MRLHKCSQINIVHYFFNVCLSGYQFRFNSLQTISRGTGKEGRDVLSIDLFVMQSMAESLDEIICAAQQKSGGFFRYKA